MQNKYELTTENELEKIFETKIKQYWDTYGKTGTFKGYKDIRINYMTFIRKNAPFAIVITTGRTECLIKYMEMVYDLGRQGISVYIYDHRGQGFSERLTQNSQKGHVHNFSDYVQDLKIFYDNIVKKGSHSKVFLLSHSMGGTIASLYALKYKKDFNGIILSSPMFEIYTKIVPYSMACSILKASDKVLSIFKKFADIDPLYLLGAGDYENKKFEKSNLTQSKARYKIFRALYEKTPYVKIGGPTVHWLSEACIASNKALESAGHIQTDILVLIAGNDTIVNTKAQEKFCSMLKKDKRVVTCIVKGAYHELFVEKDIYRNIALTKILDFIKAV